VMSLAAWRRGAGGGSAAARQHDSAT
jgi:hypothetical protein